MQLRLLNHGVKICRCVTCVDIIVHVSLTQRSMLLFLDLLILKLRIIELTHSKTILENIVEIEPQPLVLDFKNLSQYSSRSK